MGFDTFTMGPDELRSYIAERLESGEVDFVEQMQFIRRKRQGGEKVTASGVLVPLEWDASGREYAVVLNKRSIYVQQAGDLCFPGGGTDRRLDRILSRLLGWGILPTERSEPLRKLLRASPLEREVFLFIYAGVLRESWEEMRLPPWRVEYLGGLPTLWMQSFPRVIFPVVGWIRSGWKARPNWEVESVLRVPLRAFFDPSNYGICRFTIPPPPEGSQESLNWEYPCLVVNDSGKEEILWGATFRILITFMERAFELAAAQINPERRVVKKLSPDYFTGKERRRRSTTTSASWPKPR